MAIRQVNGLIRMRCVPASTRSLAILRCPNAAHALPATAPDGLNGGPDARLDASTDWRGAETRREIGRNP